MKNNKLWEKLIYSILAGIAISVGCIVFLACKSKGNETNSGLLEVLGALLFAVGLLMVMEFKFKLVTGFIPTNRDKLPFKEYIIDVLFIFVGNLIGTFIAAMLVRLTRISDMIVSLATSTSMAKINDNFWSIFILAIFCGFIIAMIVKANNYKKQALFVMIMIATFILSSFEHVVADAFYLFVSFKMFTWGGLLVLLMALLGNFVGGYLSSFIKSDEPKIEDINQMKNN